MKLSIIIIATLYQLVTVKTQEILSSLAENSLRLNASRDTTDLSELINGNPVKPDSRPYLIYLSDTVNDDNEDIYEGVYCGASLISSRAILTAASCVTQNIAALAGQNKEFKNRIPDQIIIPRGIPPIQRYRGNITIHPEFNKTTETYDVDVALMLLPIEKAILDVTPVLLNDDRRIPVKNDLLDLAGLGTNGTVTDSNIPMFVTVSYTKCPAPSNHYELCTGTQTSCVGDTGGPLVLGAVGPDFGPQYPAVQVGIVSGQYNCAASEANKFTRVSAIASWVKETVCAGVGELCPVKTKSSKHLSKASKSSKSSKSD